MLRMEQGTYPRRSCAFARQEQFQLRTAVSGGGGAAGAGLRTCIPLTAEPSPNVSYRLSGSRIRRGCLVKAESLEGAVKTLVRPLFVVVLLLRVVGGHHGWAVDSYV